MRSRARQRASGKQQRAHGAQQRARGRGLAARAQAWHSSVRAHPQQRDSKQSQVNRFAGTMPITAHKFSCLAKEIIDNTTRTGIARTALENVGAANCSCLLFSEGTLDILKWARLPPATSTSCRHIAPEACLQGRGVSGLLGSASAPALAHRHSCRCLNMKHPRIAPAQTHLSACVRTGAGFILVRKRIPLKRLQS